jgi:hypothetical protein
MVFGSEHFPPHPCILCAKSEAEDVLCLKLIAKESVKSHCCGPNHGLSMVSKELAHVLEDLKFASGHAQKLK